MLDAERLWCCLSEIGLDGWRDTLEPLLRQRLSPSGHGDFARWEEILLRLKNSAPDDSNTIRELLLALAPWRKGPFDVAGVHIDSEWQSDRKWARLVDAITPLKGRSVLDVGCGNGYYARRMADNGARAVIGVDPTLLYVLQFLAVEHFDPHPGVFVLPMRAEELPQDSRAFDSCFSMGVLYHQRAPLTHLRQLQGMLRPGGQLVLETLFLPGDEALARTPPDRYARMRNVWLLPTIAELMTWLERSGFRDVTIADTSVTCTHEQRSTEWMPFESLSEALDPGDPGRTVEGWPAPRRVVALASAP